MASTLLVGADIAKGAEVVRALDKDGVNPRAAYWLRDPETMRYQFTIALPESAAGGPRASVRRVREALERQNVDFPIWEINVVGSQDSTASLLRQAVQTGPQVVAEIHFTGNVVNNTFIDDALIYRST